MIQLKTILKFIFCLLFFSVGFIANAQQVYPPLVFSQIPQDFQLYARNDKKIATIPISGTIQDKGWKTISVSVYREGKLFSFQKSNVQVNKQEDTFLLNPIIKSEKAEYSIKIYASKSDNDSTFITERKNIVAGDFYVIYGDSNGNTQSVVDYYSTNKYIRSFGKYNQEAQRDYLPKDTLWSQSENFSLPRVGAWGTMLQEFIAERYDIPVAIITGGGPGMYIDLLTDRTGTGLNPGGVYNSFGYRIKKSGLIDNIKGLFLWHGVYELFSKPNPVEYDAKLKKMMGFFEQDFPNIQQYIVFQSGIVKFSLNGDDGAFIRESQRNMSSLFPKVISYAAEGLKGYDGVHYSKQGYEKCAEEMLSMLEPLFYEKPFEPNVISPNLQKVFYVDENHFRIKLVFQENQQIVLGNDTTIRNNGQEVKLSLKKNFFQDEIFSKNIDIQDISSQNNTVTILNNVAYSAKRLAYLPPFHKDYSADYPIFIGPYIKNKSQTRAMAFNDVKIQEPLPNPKNLSATATPSQIKLFWSIAQLPKNAQLFIERKSEKDDNYRPIKTLATSVLEYTDAALPNATTYSYQLKIASDSSESIYSQITVKTLEGLAKPKLTSTILYNNKAQLAWNTVNGAENYLVQRRLKSSNQYTTLINSANNSIKSLIDSSLTPNQGYLYKISTTRKPDEITSDSIEVFTPAFLTKPELSSTILFYDSLKINWKEIVGALFYTLERKSGNEVYKQIATPDSKSTEWIDKDLVENTGYSYRLKAFGDKTESLENIITVQTPAILSTPELTAETVTHENIKLKWKSVTNANKYFLERLAQGETTFQKIFETDDILEYSDVKLKDNTAYSYRLKALSNVSESGYVKIDLKTLAILATQSEENTIFKVFPNPTSEQLTISFIEPISGNLSFVDLLGKTVFEQKMTKQKRVEINVSTFKKGIYLVLIKTNQELYSQKVIIE